MRARSLALAALGSLLLVGAVTPASAYWRGRGHWGWGPRGYIWIPEVYVGPAYAPPVYYAPPPVYYAPPAYYAPPIVSFGVRLH